MVNPQGVLIWSGRMHVGDEPGIYGDAPYAGTTLEFPMTFRPFPGPPGGTTPKVALVITAEAVTVYNGYPGHELVVTSYVPLDPADPVSKWKEVPVKLGVGEGRIAKEGETRISLMDLPANAPFATLRVRVDTTVAAGLYDDFLVTRVAYDSATHYAMFGFRS